MTNAVAQNVTISSSAAAILTIAGSGIPGTGILIDSASAFTLTITARVGVDASQAWTNNSGNLFTVSGATLALGEANILTVNGTGNTLISAAISDTGTGIGSAIIKDGSGTLTITGNNTYSGGTTVNSGTLLVNGRGDLGTGSVTVNNSGTIGGDSTSAIISRGSFDDARNRLTVAAGGNLAPGNGGNNTAVITLHALTLEPASNFRIDINGTSPGTGYDRLVLTGAGNNRYVITNSNLVVSVGTTLSVGQTFLIGLRTAGGSIRGEFAQGNSVVGSDGTVFSVSYIGGDGNDIVLTVISRARSRAEHMDRRCACDRWARFHAAPQTAEVDSAAPCGWLLNGCELRELHELHKARRLFAFARAHVLHGTNCPFHGGSICLIDTREKTTTSTQPMND